MQINPVGLQSRSDEMITEICPPLLLDLIVDLQHKCLHQLHTSFICTEEYNYIS